MAPTRWLDVHKARIMLGSSLGMTITAIAITWRFSRFVANERELEAVRIEAVRVEAARANAEQVAKISAVQNEVAEVGKAVQIHGVQTEALKDQFVLRMEAMVRDQLRLQDDMRRLEAATSAEMREIRADIRTLVPKPGVSDGKK